MSQELLDIVKIMASGEEDFNDDYTNVKAKPSLITEFEMGQIFRSICTYLVSVRSSISVSWLTY